MFISITDHINGCLVFHRSKKGSKLAEILAVCVGEKVPQNHISRTVPQAIRENVVFVVDIEDYVSHQDLSVDDNGVYGRHSSPRESFPNRTVFRWMPTLAKMSAKCADNTAGTTLQKNFPA